MKFVGLDGREHSLDVWKYEKKSKASASQRALGDAVRSLLPNYRILEEMPCPGAHRLRLDVFVPALMLAFEFDGEQHRKYSPRFHKDRAGFARAKNNDADKDQWCEENGIRLIRVEEVDEARLAEAINEATRD